MYYQPAEICFRNIRNKVRTGTLIVATPDQPKPNHIKGGGASHTRFKLLPTVSLHHQILNY